jgi:hypothetical protein
MDWEQCWEQAAHLAVSITSEVQILLLAVVG